MSIEKYITKATSNKSFCVYPWVSLMVNTSGTLNYCCIAKPSILRDENKRQLTLEKHTLQDAWNSFGMKELRRKMLNGETIKECNHCYLQEKIGKKSFRQMHNTEWTKKLGPNEISRRIQESKDNEYELKSNPVYLDLRLSNLCNLKCRMCSPHNSNQIAKEHKKLYDKNKDYTEVWTKAYGKNPTWYYETDYKEQFESDNLWKDARAWIPNLRKIYITGGEPTLIKHNTDFLGECIKQGYGDKIEIFLNTNCTNLNKKFLDIIQQFDKVIINASLDGIGETNEYIRYPSRWPILEKNYLKMLGLFNVGSNITPVLQIYNLHSIHEVFYFADKIGDRLYGENSNKTIGVDILINTHPTFFDVRNLPIEWRQDCKNELLKFKEEFTLYDKNFIAKNSIDGIVNYLDLPQLENYKENLNDFMKMTVIQDKTRKQNFADLNNELFYKIKQLIK